MIRQYNLFSNIYYFIYLAIIDFSCQSTIIMEEEKTNQKLYQYISRQNIDMISQQQNLTIIDFMGDETDKIIFIAKDQNQKQVIVKPVKQSRQIQIMEKFKGNLYIIQIINDFWFGKMQFIVMQKAKCDLDHYIQRCEVISQENLIEITLNILQGLNSMHEHIEQFWHRDLKPANIFIFTKNNRPLKFKVDQKVNAKIGDFGSAREYNSKLTSGVGTDAFKSPQMQNKEQNYNNKIDVWSLGLTLFELYSKTSYTMYFKKPQNQYKWQTEHGCQLIQDYLLKTLDQTYKGKYLNSIKNIIKKCIHHNPSKRQSIKHILNYFIDQLKLTDPIRKINIILTQIGKHSIKNISNSKRHHQNFVEDLDLIKCKIDHFLQQIKPEISKKVSQRKLIMMNQIKENLEYEKSEYEKVITKYNEIIKAENQILKFIEQTQPTDDAIKLKIIQIKNKITEGNNILNKIRTQAMKNLDVCFLIDGTGSMSSLINKVIQKISKIVVDLKNSKHFINIRFSYVIYRDFDQKEKSIQASYFITKNNNPVSQIRVQSIKSPYLKPLEILEPNMIPKDMTGFDCSFFIDSSLNNFTSISQKFLKDLKITGGGDSAQDINGGLQKTMQLDWKSYSKTIFHFTDAPCHCQKYNGLTMSDDFLQKTPQSDIQYSKIFSQFKTVGIHYFIIQVSNSKSVQYMYDQFKKEYQNVNPYRCRVNTLGTINFISNTQYKEQDDFSKLILQMGKKVNLITTATIESKRRIPKSKIQYQSQSPFDLENQIKEFKD